jgi:hypothetical protein
VDAILIDAQQEDHSDGKKEQEVAIEDEISAEAAGQKQSKIGKDVGDQEDAQCGDGNGRSGLGRLSSSAAGHEGGKEAENRHKDNNGEEQTESGREHHRRKTLEGKGVREAEPGGIGSLERGNERKSIGWVEDNDTDGAGKEGKTA